MTKNIDISKVLAQTEQSMNVETVHSLKKVSEEIQQAMDTVDLYRLKVNSLQPPVVNGEPWYKFPFGKASVKEVNKVLESFSKFVQETFRIVSISQELQNENDMNICRLVGLLAMAEANSYEKLNDLASEMKDLSTEDEESVKQLKELEKSFLQSLDDSAIDNAKKEEQMSRLVDYITLFAENKTKKIRSISLSLSEIKTKLDKYSTIQDNWITDAKAIISSWQEEVYESLKETSRQLNESVLNLTSKKFSQFDDSFEEMRNYLSKTISKQDAIIKKEIELIDVRINASHKAIEEKIVEYKSIIEYQTKTISIQTDSIKNQNETIILLQRRIQLALFMATIAITSMIAFIIYMLMQ